MHGIMLPQIAYLIILHSSLVIFITLQNAASHEMSKIQKCIIQQQIVKSFCFFFRFFIFYFSTAFEFFTYFSIEFINLIQRITNGNGQYNFLLCFITIDENVFLFFFRLFCSKFSFSFLCFLIIIFEREKKTKFTLLWKIYLHFSFKS